VHIYTQTIHKTNSTQYNTKSLEECGPCPIFAGFTLALALQLREKHGNTSVRVAEECHLLLSRTLFIAYSVIMGPQHVTNSRILNTIPMNFTTGKVVTTEKKIIRSSTLIRSDIFPMHNQTKNATKPYFILDNPWTPPPPPPPPPTQKQFIFLG